ncbi:MAG TPA: D-alanyl-D-alanine carboxypeptidase/D-alanyl-D-alanine-endopeptidase, partial [Burkholderiales bacterium]|nr:D-alanyl-D-alanine carboxypeptidase/D-alanyl-D-alanine-endopeptidase [Burkholderiales bacterium]
MSLRLFLVVLFFSFQAHASGLPGEIANEMKATGIPAEHFGIYVRDVSKMKPVISWHAAESMSPASTMKLVTTYAALSLLGPAYTWKTEAYVSGNVENGVLKGPLALKGYGDPELNIERLWLFVRKMRALGLREIRGGLVFDRSYFSVPGDPASFDGKPFRPYNVIPDALLVNFEATSIDFIPEGENVRLLVLPDFPSLSVDNRLKTSDRPCNDWEEGISEKISSDGKTAKIEFEGAYPSACGEKEDSFALYDHSEYLYQLFSMLWKESGGKIGGGWRNGMAGDAKLFASTQSPPLSSVIVDMNKYSNNVMARQLFLTIGTLSRIPSTEADSEKALKSWLKEKNLDFPEIVLENGSGLSRKAAISPEHMGELLLDAYSDPLM